MLLKRLQLAPVCTPLAARFNYPIAPYSLLRVFWHSESICGDDNPRQEWPCISKTAMKVVWELMVQHYRTSSNAFSNVILIGACSPQALQGSFGLCFEVGNVQNTVLEGKPCSGIPSGWVECVIRWFQRNIMTPPLQPSTNGEPGSDGPPANKRRLNMSASPYKRHRWLECHLHFSLVLSHYTL